jgi:hypothetical protein
MTGQTSEGARRVRVVPRPAPGPRSGGTVPPQSGPLGGTPAHAGPVDADTDVLPRIAAGPAPAPGPGSPPGPAPGRAAGPAPASPPARPRPGTPDDAAPADAAEAPEPPERRIGMGPPALVLGVLAAGTCWTGWAGVVLGLFAVAAGYLGARRAWKGLATDGAASLGGLALGAVGLVVGVVVVWPTLFGTGNFGDGLTLDQCLQQANGAFQMHMCKSQHIAEFNQRFPNAAT